MNISNIANTQCIEKTDYIVPILMILFFIAGYLVFKKKNTRPISPSIKPNKFNKNNITEDFDNKEENEEYRFFLDE